MLRIFDDDAGQIRTKIGRRTTFLEPSTVTSTAAVSPIEYVNVSLRFERYSVTKLPVEFATYKVPRSS